MSKKKRSFSQMQKDAIKKVQSQAPEVIQQTDEKKYSLGSFIQKFPLPIKDMGIYRENLFFVHRNPFIVCAFFTPSHMRYYKFAQRFLSSCKKFNLPCCIYLLPDIHRSISLSGCDDLAFTKANFIAYNLERFPEKNILYIDIDILFVEYPEIFAEISRTSYDFAIYNWLSDLNNATFPPLLEKIGDKIIDSELHMYASHILHYCTDQLMCSGGVQFYRNCLQSKYFLKAWQNIISKNPYCADDECLDYAYNNLDSSSIKLQPLWLEMSYLRLPCWPHIKPVILHPGMPKAGEKRISLKNRYYPEKCQKRNPTLTFPMDYVIDTKNKLLIKYKNSEVIDEQRIEQDFWIYHEDIE